MTTAEEIQHHQARCQPHLLRLRMLACGDGEARPTAAEVSKTTGVILVEAQAASLVALTDEDSGHPGAGTFLTQRSRVQIPPRYQGQRPSFEQEEGLWP